MTAPKRGAITLTHEEAQFLLAPYTAPDSHTIREVYDEVERQWPTTAEQRLDLMARLKALAAATAPAPPEPPLRREQLEEALRSLGDTWGEVALNLKREGVKGEPGKPHACPVARYLTARFGRSVVVGAYIAGIEGAPVLAEVPKPVTEFIQIFDKVGCLVEVGS